MSIGFQSVVESVNIIIPQAYEQIFEAIQGIIDGFMNLFKDPKTSLFKIGKGTLMYVQGGWQKSQPLLIVICFNEKSCEMSLY